MPVSGGAIGDILQDGLPTGMDTRIAAQMGHRWARRPVASPNGKLGRFKCLNCQCGSRTTQATKPCPGVVPKGYFFIWDVQEVIWMSLGPA